LADRFNPIAYLCGMLPGKTILKFYPLFALLLSTACIETSDFNAWDTSDSQVVIEARLTDIDTIFTVLVSRSVSPDDTISFNPVNNAKIILKNNQGNTDTLVFEGNGKYQSSDIRGIPGNSYLLVVNIDSIIYRSIETMPSKPKIDSVSVKYQDYVTIFDTIGYYVSYYSGKNDDTIQYYRVEIEKNGIPFDDYADLLLYEDSHIATTYQMRLPYQFNSGDTVSVKIYSLSAPVYEYFSGLAKQFTYNFSNIQPPLMDPKTNFRSDPLGYFQASSVAISSVIIPTKQ
jgi:hypothetical protein